MERLKIKSSRDGKISLTLTFDSSWQEYKVNWFEGGELDIDKTYFTDCKEDAIETMDFMIERYNKQQERKMKND
jgi:hypothetical protein